MPKHVVNHSVRHELLIERDTERKQRLDALQSVNVVAPGIGNTLGPALIGLNVGRTMFHHGSFDDEAMAVEVHNVAVVDMPGDTECTVVLAATEIPDGESVETITFGAARILLEGFEPIDVRPQRKYADQS